jgi:KaiC/GvpD/RAD55 family RecA-like ATPase
MHPDRMISGIDLLDDGAGGLLAHKIYLVRGASGVGKTLLGLQYLTRGLELREPGVLITDQKPANVMAQARAIGFAIDEPILRGQLAILNASSRYFQLVNSPADVMAIVQELFDHIRRIGARRLVIDPVYTLINTSYSAHFALSIAESLMRALEDLPVTTLLIARNDQAPELNRQLEQEAFGIIDLSDDRVMRLSKLRCASNESLSAPYRIASGRGLVSDRIVESASREQPSAVYWIEGSDDDLAHALKSFCREEDIAFHNKRGEFVAILTGTDENGVRGFELRLREMLGERFESSRHGFTMRQPGSQSALDAAETKDHAGEERGVEGARHHQLDVIGDRQLAQ